MGGGHWSDDSFRSTSSTRATKTREEVFTSKAIHKEMDPTKMVVRESRDSLDHPTSNAIIVGFDVTGSMGDIPEYFSKTALGVLMADLLKKLPVPDPQLLVAAIGDAHSDKFPLQVGQFESDNRVDEDLVKMVLEGGGGGTAEESYGLVHYFAGSHTSIDCFEKRGVKGFLFTVGDEKPYDKMTSTELKKVFGSAPQTDVSAQAAIASAQRMYNVFHIVVKSRAYDPNMSLPTWRALLGQHVLVLEDYKALAETIIAQIAVTHGMSLKDATAGFSPAVTSMVLRSGISLPATVAHGSGDIAKL